MVDALRCRQLQTNLRNIDATLPSQFFFSLFTRIRVREVRVKVLVQNLRRLFAEIPPLASTSANERREKKTNKTFRKCVKRKNNIESIKRETYLFFRSVIKGTGSLIN